MNAQPTTQTEDGKPVLSASSYAYYEGPLSKAKLLRTPKQCCFAQKTIAQNSKINGLSYRSILQNSDH